MKNILVIVLTISLTLILVGCTNNEDLSDLSEAGMWDCTVSCAELSDAENYVISYSSEEIISRTGILSLQNQNDFDIVVHLLSNGREEKVSEIPAGETVVLHEMGIDTEYMVGCHANVDEGTEIGLMVYDGEETY